MDATTQRPWGMNASTKLPTNKVLAATMASTAGVFFADLLVTLWAAFPASGEPFLVAAFTFAVAYYVPERRSSYSRVAPRTDRSEEEPG
ncbi:MAG: hypothetical protein AAF170_08510 [Bacteroidota bacterium]